MGQWGRGGILGRRGRPAAWLRSRAAGRRAPPHPISPPPVAGRRRRQPDPTNPSDKEREVRFRWVGVAGNIGASGFKFVWQWLDGSGGGGETVTLGDLCFRETMKSDGGICWEAGLRGHWGKCRQASRQSTRCCFLPGGQPGPEVSPETRE